MVNGQAKDTKTGELHVELLYCNVYATHILVDKLSSTVELFHLGDCAYFFHCEYLMMVISILLYFSDV